MASKLYDFTLPSIDGDPQPLSGFRGKVLLLVNVASRCGLTPQYQGLETVYEKYRERGFEVLGFPANNFGAQEPGTEPQIKKFCTLNYNVKFPMYAKVSVKGEDQVALYRYLTKDTGDGLKGEIQWNFTKFLADQQGNVVRRFEPNVTPDAPEVIAAIENLLQLQGQ